jgi:hypothetical protein
MHSYKKDCLEALSVFMEDSCNENKMELIIAFDELESSVAEEILGQELYSELSRIVIENDHPDDYLQILKLKYFSA